MVGELERADNWEGRFRHLNHSMHNYLRITRILKCLGEFNYEHLKAPFVRFVLYEAIIERTLSNTLDSCLNYWLQVIKDDKERKEVKKYAQKLFGGEQNKKKKKNYGYRFWLVVKLSFMYMCISTVDFYLIWYALYEIS